MTDSASSLSNSSPQPASDTICDVIQPHHHHRHHHHLPQPQIIYVVANPQDLPINAYPQNWPPPPGTLAPIPHVNVAPILPSPAPPVHTPSPASATVDTSNIRPVAPLPSPTCTTIVDDCCADCCPTAAEEKNVAPSLPCCSSPSLEHPRVLPLPFAMRPAVSHHFQSLRPIGPYTMSAPPPSTSSTPVASAISDYHRQHNVFAHHTPRLSTPQIHHGQPQRHNPEPRSMSAPVSPVQSSSQSLATTNDTTTQVLERPEKETEPVEQLDQNQTVTDAQTLVDSDETAASSLVTLATAATEDKPTSGQKRKLDEQQGEARCLWAACAAVFKCIDDLIPHLTKLHVASRSIKDTNQCRWETCQTKKEDSDELISHVCEEHLGAPELKHGCHWKGCETRFESFDDLTGHLSERHIGTGKSQYVCSWEECERQGRAFTQRQKVMRHIQTHTGDRPYQCNVCNKRFSEANIMTQHMRRHTGEKPYRCQEQGCSKEFSISGALTIHKRVHSGEKPFRCKFEGCDKRFAESSNLTKHTRVHTGERPFKCTLPSCDRRFSRPDQLTRHEKTHQVK